MNIKEAVSADFKEAFKSGDALAKSVISMLKSVIKNKEIDNKGVELTDDQIIDLISTEIKRRRDSSKQYKEGGREDLAKNEEDEIVILQKYMPAQLSESEIKELVQKAVKDTGAQDIKDLGKVMAALKDATKGKADGSVVSQIVKDELSK